MRDLKTFQETVEAYRKNAPTPHTQKELAAAISLDKDELSKRLNAYRHPDRNISPLSCAQVQTIVRILARWGAIQTQEQAKELLDLMKCPHFSDGDWKAHPLNHLSAPPPTSTPKGLSDSDRQREEEKRVRLRAMLVDRRGFLRDRVKSFVGRQMELKDIHQLISVMLPTGGYITITGRAGQGKSCIIAKLVQEYGPEKTIYHFIPFNPGPDYQINLLRDLMAQLILKHDLSELYVTSESYPVLRDYFPKVLNELVEKGRHEVIFIDGLDQLKEDADGERDLSFLPNNSPSGVVFVLGTRPNDTLRPLELRKPHQKYILPNMSRHDFDLILEHRRVKLDILLVDQLYQTMQENALFLDLVAKELAKSDGISVLDLMKRIADNPENLFTLSMDRLGRSLRDDSLWNKVIKPILGVLLVAREPLVGQHIGKIIGVDADRLNEGMRRLGGMVTDDGQQRYALFHLKLRDYLRQDEASPNRDHVFTKDEERAWHKILADWCKQGNLCVIWEDANHDPLEQGRRKYARRHYITHLYYAHDWIQLFDVLDKGDYGRAKVRDDPSMHTYAQDLDLGRQVAAWNGWTIEEGVALLPYLWRYTLLRCSLGSQADQYTPEDFEALMLLGREQEALGLVELLTDPYYKLCMLLQIASYLRKQSRQEQEVFQLFMRAYEVSRTIEDSRIRAWMLSWVGCGLIEIHQWERAEAIWVEAKMVAHTIEDIEMRVEVLSELGRKLAKTQQWEQAEAIWVSRPV